MNERRNVELISVAGIIPLQCCSEGVTSLWWESVDDGWFMSELGPGKASQVETEDVEETNESL